MPTGGRRARGGRLTAPAGILARATRGLAAGGSLLLLADYDGTLTPIMENPAVARLGPAARRSLRALARSPRARVAVLSGRALDDLRRRVRVAGAFYAGCHGLEIRGPGLAFTHPRAAARRATLEEVARELRLRSARIPGVLVETKGLAVAVHHRCAPPGAEAHLDIEVQRAASRHGDALALLRGKKVIEILPRVAWNKGACARWIVGQLAPALSAPVAILCMGDDRTDESTFGALAGSAITVKVGPGGDRSWAIHRLRDVTEVHRLLAALAAAVRAPRKGRA